MRASKSCPRSSVPKGCRHDGVSMRALKSMSLIATFQTKGPSAIAAIIASRMKVLASASRCRRNRRHASRHGEKGRVRRCGAAATSAERDARIEPSIKDVRDEVEQDDEAGKHEGHRPDDRLFFGEDGADLRVY